MLIGVQSKFYGGGGGGWGDDTICTPFFLRTTFE